jgi:hypothetical protein
LAESTLSTPPSGSIVGAECSDDDGIKVVLVVAFAAAVVVSAAAAVDVSVVVVAVVIDSVVASRASGRGVSSVACNLAAGVAGTSMTVTASTAALPVTSAAVKSDGRGRRVVRGV